MGERHIPFLLLPAFAVPPVSRKPIGTGAFADDAARHGRFHRGRASIIDAHGAWEGGAIAAQGKPARRFTGTGRSFLDIHSGGKAICQPIGIRLVGVASGGHPDAVITEKRLQFCERFAESIGVPEGAFEEPELILRGKRLVDVQPYCLSAALRVANLQGAYGECGKGPPPRRLEQGCKKCVRGSNRPPAAGRAARFCATR